MGSRRALVSLLVLAMACGTAEAVPEDRHAAAVKGVRSLRSELETRITFVNRSDQPIQTHWLDFDGKRKLYETVPPGKQVDQPTFVMHPWVVTDARGRAWGVYYPDAQPRTIEIRAPK